MKRNIIWILSLLFLSFSSIYAEELEILWQDLFNDNSNEWLLADDEEALTKIEYGTLVFQHKREDGGYFAWNYFSLDDTQPFSIQTRIKHVAGVEDYGYGLVWGMSDVENYYAFEITVSGYYRIAKTEANEWYELVEWTESSSVKSSGYNKLRIDREGDKLKFYINDSLVDQLDFMTFFDYGTGFSIWLNQTIEVDDLTIKGTDNFDYDELLDLFDEYYGE